MTTRFIGIKEFRQNMAKVSNAARKQNQLLIVLRKNEPLFELRPLSKNDMVIQRFSHDIEEAKKDVRTGRLYDQKDIEKMLGL